MHIDSSSFERPSVADGATSRRQPKSRRFTDSGSDLSVSREMRTLILERHDRLRPATAGIFAGAAAGTLMLTVVDRILHARPDGYDLVLFLGKLVSGGHLAGAEAHAAGLGVALVAGALLGAAFATLTRHLRRFAFLLLWSVVFFPAMWTLLQAFVLPTVAPWVSDVLPFVPMLVGSVVYGVVVSLQLPLRRAAERTL